MDHLHHGGRGRPSGDGRLDFGYHWAWTYGYLAPLALFLALLTGAWLLGAPWWIIAVPAAVAAWALAGFLIARFVVRMNQPLAMPAAGFLAGGTGRVLDIGCGAGRTTLMVATARPQADVLALDNFSADYISDHGAPHIMRNMAAAGVDRRVTIEKADMLRLPFEQDTFDAAVSSYAMDHLTRPQVAAALAEARRVVRPGGEFLLMVIVPSVWSVVAYSPLILRVFPRSRFWRDGLAAAGFDVASEGWSRGARWFLAQ
jgi:SAM-dependent methyltransferase